MEINGIRLVLTLFAPFAIIVLILLLIYPLQSRLFDREKPLKKELRDKRSEFKKIIKERLEDFNETTIDKGIRPSSEQLEEFKGELKTLRKEYTDFAKNKTKEIIKVHNEESGVADLMKIRVENPTVFYVSSMSILPIATPIVLGFSSYFLPETAAGNLCLLLLPLPIVGAWLAYKGYTSLQKIKALVLCLAVNTLYASLLLFGALVMR